MTLEQKALDIAASRPKLRARLLEARAVLGDAGRKLFDRYTFDFDNKRLISAAGGYCLQWRLRRHPDQPAGYENQQTSTGDVVLCEV